VPSSVFFALSGICRSILRPSTPAARCANSVSGHRSARRRAWLWASFPLPPSRPALPHARRTRSCKCASNKPSPETRSHGTRRGSRHGIRHRRTCGRTPAS
jgi:hypothetical protein